VAALKRHRPADDPEITAAVGDFAAARLEEHIRKVVDKSPPLTPEQRQKLSVLLAGSGGDAG
jgi:hypothetical protein